MPMDPRRIASIAAVLGGVVWLARVGLVAAGTAAGVADVLLVLGLGLLVVALAAAGYTLVETAPVWLRAVVALATPLLVMMVWQLLDQGIKAAWDADGWLRDEATRLLAAVLALVLGGWGFRRRPPARDVGATQAEPPAPVRGRRAAR